MRCLATATGWTSSSPKSASSGFMHCEDAVKTAKQDGTGDERNAWQDDTYHALTFSTLTQTTAFTPDSRQEPYEVVLHVRICAGGGWKQPSLPRSTCHELTPIVTDEVEKSGDKLFTHLQSTDRRPPCPAKLPIDVRACQSMKTGDICSRQA